LTYPGNSALSPEVRERVISTFRQMVDLYNQGRFDEVAAGCDLITKMDQMFVPARKLAEKLNNPAASIDVESLLDGLGGPADGGGMIEEAKAAYAVRDFQRTIEICQGILATDPANPEAQTLASVSQERIESEPFVAQFVVQARRDLAAGNLAGAKSAIDKACSLDETHPEVLELLEAYAAAEAGGGAPAMGFDAGTAFADAFAAPAGADFSSAFVVEQQTGSAPASDATPASDFGFTFEEEQAAPAPAAPPAPAPAESSSGFGGQEFDFGSASVDVSDDDATKIAQYLAEGDAAYAGGDYQRAIDIWSKIFLIDVTNDDASRRIEEARQKRLEVDQQIEDFIVAGTLAFEKQDYDEARRNFEDVLRLDPSHFNASEYLQKINDMESVSDLNDFVPPPQAAEPEPSVADLYDDIYDAPAQTMAPEPQARVAAAPAARRIAIPRGVLFGAVGLIVVLAAAAGWYLTRDRIPAYDPAVTQAEFDRAKMLAEHGEFQDAINVLSAINPSDPQHNRALELIAEYKKQAAQRANLIDGRPPGEVYQERLELARGFFAQRNYLDAKRTFESASAIQQLGPEDQEMYRVAVSQAAKLDAASVLFTEGRYADAITTLETLLAEDPENLSIRLVMSNAYFNLGRTALERENLQVAAQNFAKVLEYNPQDEIARRSRDFALRYDGQPKDLLYKIYVKHLKPR
jgi:tetratricopeptide (TPR) repeat protein